jgi:predicted metalloprotease
MRRAPADAVPPQSKSPRTVGPQSTSRPSSPSHRDLRLLRLIGVMCAVLLVLAGCNPTVIAGHPRSMRYDPERVGGLELNAGPNGLRPTGPPPSGTVDNTDGGAVDRLALLAINDIEAFWKEQYPKTFGGPLRPVSVLLSVDPADVFSPSVCGASPEEIAGNAAYCNDSNSINWDRSAQTGMLSVGRKYFGEMAVVGILAHEYGHAIQNRAELPELDNTLVSEQQADCFAGVYLRWVAEDHSPRFTLSTGDRPFGLNYLLAGILALRDPLSTPGNLALIPNPHGSGLDRVGALQVGFEQGTDSCAQIDAAEIDKRRGDLPGALFNPFSQNSDMQVDEDALSSLTEVLQQIFHPSQPPSVTTGSAACSGGQPTKFAAYCPSSNTVAVNLPALQQIAAPADEENQEMLLQGDNTALSLVTSRYVMALERERGLDLDTPAAAMRTACLTGVAQREMAQPTSVTSGQGLTLGAGDLDEAIAGLLTNGVVASDVNGATLPAGFTRISAFRSGLLSDADDCYRRF